jgi:3-hydroxyacyl-CoA dehydrogenase/enoyl-CoA hydratase/3-hydroxybutyryl-CoA epimerase
MQGESEKIFNEKVLNDKRVKALIFISSKSDNFIAGADIDMIKAVEDKSQLKDICLKGTSFFEEVKKKANIPFVAAINGAALGGNRF